MSRASEGSEVGQEVSLGCLERSAILCHGSKLEMFHLRMYRCNYTVPIRDWVVSSELSILWSVLAVVLAAGGRPSLVFLAGALCMSVCPLIWGPVPPALREQVIE